MAGKKRQPPLYLLTGLIIGLGLGLLIGYRILPVQFFDIAPSSLQQDYKPEYLALVALAYNADQDIGRAQSRISQMMAPIDIDSLRSMSLKLNDNPRTKNTYEPVRSFINDLLDHMTYSAGR